MVKSIGAASQPVQEKQLRLQRPESQKEEKVAPVHELCDVERFAGMCKDVFGNGTSGFAKDIQRTHHPA